MYNNRPPSPQAQSRASTSSGKRSFCRGTRIERPFFKIGRRWVILSSRVLRPSECKIGGAAFRSEVYHSQSDQSLLPAKTLKAARIVNTVQASSTAFHETSTARDTTVRFWTYYPSQLKRTPLPPPAPLGGYLDSFPCRQFEPEKPTACSWSVKLLITFLLHTYLCRQLH